ncbi:MAG: hypothetical protein L0956_05695 [Candidatus Mariimomonas ferrooxydans]
MSKIIAKEDINEFISKATLTEQFLSFLFGIERKILEASRSLVVSTVESLRPDKRE